MSEWTEQWLRGAASWRAFKEGRMLADAGAVEGARKGSSGWQGNVRVGKRVFRVAVKVVSATDVETRCGCPENQASGELCAHGVAAGLAAIGAGTREQPAEAVVHPPPAVAGRAWEIAFPPNWREMLRRGKCAVALTTVEEEPTAADERLTAWLLAAGRTGSPPPLHLHLDGEAAGAFLECLVEHPRLAAGKERGAIECRAGARAAVRRLERMEDKVRFDGGGEALFQMGGRWWRFDEGGVGKIGRGEPVEEVAKSLAALAAGRAIQAPVRRFLNRLPEWQEWVELPAGSWIESLHFVPASVRFELSLEGSARRVEAELRVGYLPGETHSPVGEEIPGLPVLHDDRCEVRNVAEERKAIERLEKMGFWMSGGKGRLEGEALVQNFLFNHLSHLEREWQVSVGAGLRDARKQIVYVEPKIEILGSGEDWLSFDLKFEASDGSVIPLSEIKRLLRGGGGKSGKKIVLSADIDQMIDPLLEESEIRQERGHFQADGRTGEIISEIHKNVVGSLIYNIEDKMFTFTIPASMRANMRLYQSGGAGWMVDRLNRFGGALLADDMGLGKTLQSIAVIERLFEEVRGSGVVLVVATASLLGNWKTEFGRFAPGRTVRIFHGAGREEERGRVSDGEVVLTSFGTLARDLAWHLNRSYEAVIVDEASLMRNPETDHAKALFKLDAKRRIALTGTPIENGVRDLWSIFRFVQPGWLGTREWFKERYELPLAAGESAVLKRLRIKVSPFLLRRTKEEVAPELPSKIFIDEVCELSQEQRSVYRDLLAEGRKRVETARDSGNAGAARMQVLTALLRLRQTCCDLALLGNDRFNRLEVARRSAKMERLMELVGEAVSGGHKILVFSQFQKQLLEIEKCLEAEKIECLRLDGQTRKRQELVERFQANDGPPVFLISLKAGGYGLNLTAADVVIHFDPWWNPAAEAQATDRAHRIGQTRPVTVYRLLTRGTVEEKVVGLQAKKRELAAVVDEAGGGDAAGWSEAELLEVLG